MNQKLRIISIGGREKLKKGKNYIVIYYQEGKRLSYYSGNYLKEKKDYRWYYRKMDRSNQKFFLESPHYLIEI